MTPQIKQKLIFWGIYVGLYYVLAAVAGLPFSVLLFVILMSVFLIIYSGNSLWGIRFLGYIGIMISLFADGYSYEGSYGTLVVFARLFILGLGFLGFLIEYLMAAADEPKEKVDKSFQVMTGRCPKCLKEIPRLAVKCPYCLTELTFNNS